MDVTLELTCLETNQTLWLFPRHKVKLTTHIKLGSKVKKNGGITRYSTIWWNCHV